MRFPFQARSERDFDAVGFGTNAVDHLIRLPEYPAFGSKLEISEHVVAAGGEVATTMAGLTRLGLSTAYVGKFGGDDAGEMGLASLRRAGVDVTNTRVVDDARTQVAFILTDERSGERTVLWQRDKLLAYGASEAPIEIVETARVLHMTAHDTGACIRLASAAKAAGCIVSLDIDNVFTGLEQLLPLVDICITSEELPDKLLGISDVRTALTEIGSRFGCGVAGVTLGGRGSIFLCGGAFIETPAITISGGCVDTTGAGDAFRTGFLYGFLSGENVERSAELANVVAGLKCRAIGAREGLPALDQILAFRSN